MLQTITAFEEEYEEKITSPVNNALNLDGKLSHSTSVFPYSQQCHEATITLAYALHHTSEGQLLKSYCTYMYMSRKILMLLT